MVETQKKWRNLRTCFGREIRLQHKDTAAPKESKRRTYIYYDKLRFLLPTMKAAKNNISDETIESEDDSTIENVSLVESSNGQSTAVQNAPKSEVHPMRTSVPSRPKPIPIKRKFVVEGGSPKLRRLAPKIVQVRSEAEKEEKTIDPPKNIDADEDTYFALSIVPMLKSLDEYSKIEAKIQILSLLRSIKFSGVGEVQQMTS